MSGERRRNRLSRLTLLAVAVATTGAAHARMPTQMRALGGELFVPRPEHARFWSLGFAPVLGDYYWVQALQLVGGETGRTEAHAPLVARLIELVTSLDPWVDHPYRFAALWLTDSPRSVERANALLEKAIAYHPREWRNHYHLGFNQFFYLEEPLRAADSLERAIGLEGSPPYLGALVARLRADAGGIELAAAFLAELARNTEDGYARAEYEKALDEIETERRARALDQARLEFWRRRGRDIESVEELVAGPRPVLRGLPPAHPVFQGFRWLLDPESGEIVSSFYGSRYEPHLQVHERRRQQEWREKDWAAERPGERAAEAAAGGAGGAS
jgi:hypothetical protein